MSNLVLPQSMVRDREAGIKANAQHVDDNFNALETAVNGKLDLDGTSTPTADISWNGNKLTNLGTPSVSGDAATKGYVDSADLLKANLASPTFTGTPEAPTPASAADNTTQIATTEHVINVLKALYPVGATYIGTQNTCPLATLIAGSTWELVASNVVVDVDTTVGVKGTGSALKLKKGTLGEVQPVTSYAPGNPNGSLYCGGTAWNGEMWVNDDVTNSGITGVLTRTNLAINIWKRTA